MSYEEDYKEPYKSPCACGKGFLRRYHITESNDWGQIREKTTDIEFHCDFCSTRYHVEYNNGIAYLVPNGFSFPKQIPHLDYKYSISHDEEFVGKHTKEVIEAMIADMTAPNHRFVKNLTYPAAIEFAKDWINICRRRSLQPMIDHLQWYLKEYDRLLAAYNKKMPFLNSYLEKLHKVQQEEEAVELQSFRLTFSYDEEQAKIDQESAKKHEYDPFQALVSYHQTYKIDLIGHYWDTYLIKSCIDPEFLILDKYGHGTPRITIVKKYQCICSICKKDTVVLSSDFEIMYGEDTGYYPKVCCDCHVVSSFEAKTMDILNKLGINYKREVSFDNLTGDSGSPLRFDFGILKNNNPDLCETSKYSFLIELQGPHHYKSGYYNEYMEYIEDNSDSSKANYIKRMKYDDKKKVFCMNNSIPLECIKYSSGKDYEELEHKIKYILNRYGYI